MTLVYYVALIQIGTQKFYYLVDFPNERIVADPAELRNRLRTLLIDFEKKYHTYPVATGIAPMIYKVKKWLWEQGCDPRTSFLSYHAVDVDIDKDSTSKVTTVFEQH